MDVKPASIVTFGRLWLLSIVATLANAWITRQRVQAMLEANPQSAPVAHFALPGWTGLVLLVSLLLWFLIGRRSLTAKWAVLLLAIASGGRGVVTLVNLLGAEHRHPVSSLLMLGCTLLTIAAAAMLFRRDAREWFGEGEVDGPVSASSDARA